MSILMLRRSYHQRVCEEIIRITQDDETGYPNFADKASASSRAIAWGIVNRIGCAANYDKIRGQTAGKCFEDVTKDYLERVFEVLRHLRPGRWYYSTAEPISAFDQYEHLVELEEIVERNRDLASALGKDYIIRPDIVIGRYPVSDEEINAHHPLVSPDQPVATLTPLRQSNAILPHRILHASISCKWTLRSDRSQNARSEALNLIRNRKGRLPHIVAVTAEPMPTRIASLALGTGDLDCVYHFALYEMQQTLVELGKEDQLEMLNVLVDGRRLRDVSDLPFDLVT